MIEDRIIQLQRERDLIPATFEILNAINREHKITRSYVIENGVRLDRLEVKVDNLEKDVQEIKLDIATLKSDVSELKSDVSELKNSVNKILEILTK